ncbi:TRAP transporter small permease [Azospirillum sp. ST 5-10]|uniref:TRAP transporter small permease n=1 Tax=unclassified Azospirillum TaxID=2630922 RepID=UPI003F4A7F49
MERVIRLFDGIAFAATVAMLAVVVESVAARALFDATGGEINLIVPGAIELASYFLLILVFAALPRAALGGLVSVDLLVGALPGWLRRALERTWDLALAAFGGILAWLFGEKTLTMAARGDATQDLEVPLYLIYGTLTLFCLGLAATGVWLALRRFQPAKPTGV